tara:strand:- start:12 stop:608 length:597 start_codon:yes stop_codon:yes gene_type:complete
VIKTNQKGKINMKAMTKYQLEHFKNKVRDKFSPLIDEAQLTLRKTVADLTAAAEKKLSNKLNISDDIKQLKEMEEQIFQQKKKLATFFNRAATTDKMKDKLDYHFNSRRLDRDDIREITAERCEDQIRDWAQDLAEREAEKTKDGKKLVRLKKLKEDAISTVMESGMPGELIQNLNKHLGVIGITWHNNIKSIENNLN